MKQGNQHCKPDTDRLEIGENKGRRCYWDPS